MSYHPSDKLILRAARLGLRFRDENGNRMYAEVEGVRSGNTITGLLFGLPIITEIVGPQQKSGKSSSLSLEDWFPYLVPPEGP